jgi:ATP-dependent Clp protease protease subunit
MSSYIPNPVVVEQTPRGERQYDIYSRLLLDRIIFLGTQIDDTSANLIMAQMLFLDQADSDAPIHFYINSPGGSIYAGLGIYDIMQHITCPIYTYCVGLAASMASLLLAAGENSYRYALPHGRIMLHQPLGGATGQCSDIQIQVKEVNNLKADISGLYVKHTKIGDDVAKLIDRDNFLSPLEALDLGLIDKIVAPKK